MNPLVFGFTYLGSWLLIGLGVFLIIRSGVEFKLGLASRATVEEGDGLTQAKSRLLLAVLIVVGLGVTYAGAFTLIDLLMG